MIDKMDLSPIFDVYSMGSQTTDDAVKALTPEFKTRVQLFCEEMVHPYDHHSEAGYKIADYWMTVRDKLRYRHGLIHLADRNQHNPVTEVERFLSECNDEHYLDFIEMFFQSEELPMYFSDHALKEAVNNINTFFDMDELPYALTEFSIAESQTLVLRIKRLLSHLQPKPSPSKFPKIISSHTQPYDLPFRTATVQEYPRIIRRENEVVHRTAIEPVLTLLTQPPFATANKEFLVGLADYRKGEYEDCVTKCLSAFESVLKVVCQRKGWAYRETDTADTLLTTVFGKTSLEGFYKEHIKLILTVRNRQSSAHGGGTQPKQVPKHVANYVINATAAAILLIVEEIQL